MELLPHQDRFVSCHNLASSEVSGSAVGVVNPSGAWSLRLAFINIPFQSNRPQAQRRQQAGAEMVLGEMMQVSFPTRAAHSGAKRRIVEKKRERLKQGLAVLVGYDQAGDTMLGDLLCRPFASDTGLAGPHCLQKGQPKAFQSTTRHYEKSAI